MVLVQELRLLVTLQYSKYHYWCTSTVDLPTYHSTYSWLQQSLHKSNKWLASGGFLQEFFQQGLFNLGRDIGGFFPKTMLQESCTQEPQGVFIQRW